MLEIKLDNLDPLPGHAGMKLLAGVDQPPVKEIINPRLVAMPLPREKAILTCLVPGCKKYGHTFTNDHAKRDHDRHAHNPKHQTPMQLPPAAPPPPPAAAPTNGTWTIDPNRPRTINAGKPRSFKNLCPWCDATAWGIPNLNKHITIAHPGAPLLTPLPAGQIAARAFIRQRTLARLDRLARAKLLKPAPGRVTVMVDNVSYYACSHCDYRTTSRPTFAKHLSHEHPEHAPLTNGHTPVPAPPSQIQSPRPDSRFTPHVSRGSYYAAAKSANGNVRITGTRSQILAQCDALLDIFPTLEIGKL